MPGLISPYWLFALILLPLLWWLQRYQPQGKTIKVSSLLYWQKCEAETLLSKQGQLNHPLWLLRIIIALLLILALSRMFWVNDPVKRIDIWVDDSLSMQTSEMGRSRVTLAIDNVLAKLAKFDKVQAKLHLLNQPEFPALLLQVDAESSWQQQIQSWYKPRLDVTIPCYIDGFHYAPKKQGLHSTHPTNTNCKWRSEYLSLDNPQLPLLSQFEAGTEHWLVTDGASQNINNWAQAMPFHQFIQVGQLTENDALTVLSIRPSLKQADVWQGMLQIQHFGDQVSQRQVELFVGTKPLQQWSVSLVPQQTQALDFTIDSATLKRGDLAVHFLEPDALVADDSLSLSATIYISVKVMGLCPSALMNAIQAHPAISLDQQATDLTIICAPETLYTEGASIQFYLAPEAEPLTETPVWQFRAGLPKPLYLQADWLRFTARSPRDKNAQALLSTVDTVLVAYMAQSQRIDCFIDMQLASFTQRPEYPVFIAQLIELVFNKPILNNIQRVSRNAEFSQVKPLLSLNQPELKPVVIDDLDRLDFSVWFIVFALLLFLLDCWLSNQYSRPGR